MTMDGKTSLVAAFGDVAIGTRLSGTFELDDRLASGGMGEVFRGHNIQTGDPVAIKIVLPEFARDAVVLSLFRKEASILNHLHHEAIVRYHVFAIDQAIGRPYLAMEFVDGVSLADLIKNGPVAVADARILLSRVAAGLAAAHEAGVIHRDLSPDNIILPQGKVARTKIIDFGIARSASAGGETVLGGAFAGKYNFVSPEQLGLFGGEVTERSDIYSLGLVMAAALRGRALDMSGSQVAVIEKRRVVPDLEGIDPGLRPILEAMLQPDPRNRPASMAEIASWSRPVSQIASVTEQPRQAELLPFEMPQTGADRRGLAPRLASTASVSQAIPKRDPATGPRRRGVLMIAAGAFVVVVAAGGLAAWQTGWLEPGDETAAGGQQISQTDAPPKIAPPGTPAPPTDPKSNTEKSAEAKQDFPAQTTERPAQGNPVSTTAQGTPIAVGPVKIEGADGVGETAARVDWLKDYAGGTCFFASATSSAGAKTSIEGFGADIGGFQRLLADFKTRFKSEPDIGVRLIRSTQCPVTDFLNGLRKNPGSAPALSLAKYELADRDPMSGNLQMATAQQTYLLLVDHDGIAHNLDSILTKSGDSASFNIAVGLGAEKSIGQGAVPQVLLAITASAPVRALENIQAVAASELLPRAMAEIASRKIDAGATARYFRIHG